MDDKINKFNLIKKITFLKKLDIKKTKNKWGSICYFKKRDKFHKKNVGG
jgi:hypothetical protein